MAPQCSAQAAAAAHDFDVPLRSVPPTAASEGSTEQQRQQSEAVSTRTSTSNCARVRSILPLAVAFGCGLMVASFGRSAAEVLARLFYSGSSAATSSSAGRSVRGTSDVTTPPLDALISTEESAAESSSPEQQTASAHRRTQSSTCATSFSRDSSATSPWDRLTSNEKSIVSRGIKTALSLDTDDVDPFEVDAVRAVDLDEPPKVEMLDYLDNNGPTPQRYARAWVVHGSGADDHIMEYRVGPIDTANGSYGQVVPLTEPGTIPAHTMMLSSTQRRAVQNIVNDFVYHPTVSEFLFKAFGDTSTIEWSMHENEYEPDAPRYANVAYRRRTSLLDNILAYPLPFEFRVDMRPTNDQNQWRIINVLYRHEYYATSMDFIAAVQCTFSATCATEEEKVTIKSTAPFSSNPFWQTLDHRTSKRPATNGAPPAINVQPTKRYTVSGGQVEWLGWSFHAKNRLRTALAIHDVQFMGERIAYELSLQELQAIYTGRQPYMANKYLFDSVFRYGSLSRRLKAGVDCPTQATYFDNICVFEWDAGIPLWRKDHQGNKFYAGAKNTQLVVRSIFPVGNYDYLVEAKFSPDGSIDMGFAATGQLYMSYYDKSEESFGTKVHDEALANVHAHFAGFKVDLDILGQNNCVEKTEVKYGPRSDIPGTETDDPNLHVPAKNMYIKRTFVTSEDEARVKMNNQAPVEWKVASCSDKNTWGYHRGYDILHPNTPLGLTDDPSFHDYHMIFAQRKEDEEEYLTTPVDFLTIKEPVMPVKDMNKKVDGSKVQGISNGESLENKDIVTWISLGFYHVPRVEDSPVTNIVASHFKLQPNNYFDENPSIDLGQTERYRNGRKVESIPTGQCSVEV